MNVVTITHDTTRDELIEALGYLNNGAKDIRRKGYTGTASAAYARQHQAIDDLLHMLEQLS